MGNSQSSASTSSDRRRGATSSPQFSQYVNSNEDKPSKTDSVLRLPFCSCYRDDDSAAADSAPVEVRPSEEELVAAAASDRPVDELYSTEHNVALGNDACFKETNIDEHPNNSDVGKATSVAFSSTHTGKRLSGVLDVKQATNNINPELLPVINLPSTKDFYLLQSPSLR
jgi:hypothetical protein